MKIVIPTKGRLNNQLTLDNLPKELYKNVIVVCPAGEAFFHRSHYEVNVVAQPPEIQTIGDKRGWIVNKMMTWDSYKDDRIVMLDDDLRFAVRRDDNPGLFRKAEKEDILFAFEHLEAILSPEVPHAGFSARGGGISDAAKGGGWQRGKRMMYVLGYYLPIVKERAVFGRLQTHEDMDITLQLLTSGYPNSVNFSFVVDQKFGNKGGCTDERTIEKNNADVLKLAELFPGYVRVTEKVYKGSTNRLEVVCQWQKAMNDGLLKRK